VSIGCWIALGVLARSVEWTLVAAVLLNLIAYPVFLWLGRGMGTARIPQLPRAWFDLPMRTLLVCALMSLILVASSLAGPNVTGIIAVYPISSTSLMLILQPRVGGMAASAVMANSLWGLCGVGLGLTALGVLVVPFGAVPALAATLAIPIAWNLSVWFIRSRNPSRHSSEPGV